jgi:hypothetical protein
MAGIVQSSERGAASPVRILRLQFMKCVERKSWLTMNEQRTIARTPIGFLDLPSEVRNMIYELALVRKRLVRPYKYYYEEPYDVFGLLCASRSINREASSIFYGRNNFDFDNVEPDVLAAFLQQIGVNNAAYIRHVSIFFPVSFDYGPDGVTFDDQTMDALRNSCVNLNALTAVLIDADVMEYTLEEGDDADLVMEALNRANISFGMFPSLQNITVEIHGDRLMGYAQDTMESYGWAIKIIEPLNEDSHEAFLAAPRDYDYAGSDDDWGPSSQDHDSPVHGWGSGN